jgi:nucleoid-associated protein YgaU
MKNYTEKEKEKRLIRLFIFIIVILLIVAIAIIVYLTSQISKLEREPVVTEPQSRQEVSSAPPAPVREAIAKVVPSRLVAEENATIVQLAMTQSQKGQQAAPIDAVAQPAVASPHVAASASSGRADANDSTDDLDSVISVLGSVDVDTVEEKPMPTTMDNETNLTQAHARKTPQKANDTFNKTVVSDDGTDGFAQLGNEVDRLAQESDAPESGYEKEMKREVAERQNEIRTIVVREGDTLISIAKKAYGDGRKYETILRANPGIIKNPDHIFVGQVLRVPK